MTNDAVKDTHPKARRSFIRHTVGVPIDVRAVSGSAATKQQTVNVSVAGLSFVSESALEPGSTIEISIPHVQPPFHALARVSWSAPEHGRYCIGAQFLDAGDAFRARMVEQVCEIERYREEVARSGRVIDAQQAAAEWIAKHAEQFPSPTGDR